MKPKIIPYTTRESLEAIRREDGLDSVSEARQRLLESAGVDELPVLSIDEVEADEEAEIIIVGTSYFRGQKFRLPCSVCRGPMWHEVRAPLRAILLCTPCFRTAQKAGLLPGKAP